MVRNKQYSCSLEEIGKNTKLIDQSEDKIEKNFVQVCVNFDIGDDDRRMKKKADTIDSALKYILWINNETRIKI